MVMFTCARNIFDHFERAFRISVEQVIDWLVIVCHVVQILKFVPTLDCSFVPIIETDVVVFPRFGDGVAYPGEILT